MSEGRKAIKAEFSAWMTDNLERLGLSQNELARLTKVSPMTISRYCKADTKGEPKLVNVQKIARVFGVPPPATLSFENDEGPGMAEPGVEPINAPLAPGEEWNGNISKWLVKDNTMQVAGYIRGDEITADARIQPIDRDVVVANLYDQGGGARTVLRVYKAPGYLIPATSDAADFEVHEVGKNAAIFGVVVQSIRRRIPR